MKGESSHNRSFQDISWRRADEFAGVYDAYVKKIWRHIYLRVNRREETNDLVAEVFLKTWEYLKGGKSINNIQAFLYRTAHNCIIDWYRRQNYVVELETSLEENERIELIPREDFAEQLILSASAHQSVEKILQQLPERERNLLVMRFIDELEIREIAEILHKTSGAVSVGIYRALKSFEKKLNPHEIQ